MDKGIGFNRTITLKWLNAAANLRSQTDDLATIRQGLELVLLDDMKGVEARRKTIDVLVNIWLKSGVVSPSLYSGALDLLPEISEPQRVWLHYGLILVYFPFFRQCTAIIGQIARVRETFTRQMVKDRLAGEIGHFGDLNRSTERLMASLEDWNILVQQNKNENHLVLPPLTIGQTGVQAWLLACALFSHPAEEMPFADLINLPELFPFRFSITLDDLRRNNQFIIQRQGGWEMVRLNYS
jgi:hypothetical protein